MLTFVVAIVLLCVAGVVLSAPLVLHKLEAYQGAGTSADPSTSLKANEAGRLLEALSELDHSRDAGKVTLADYATQRERLEREYLQVVGAQKDGV